MISGMYNNAKKYSVLLTAVFLNVLILFVFLLMFEPTPKYDDYIICNILSGGVNGEYSPFLLYGNIILGYFYFLILKLLPGISLYYILQFVFMFIAFSSISYVLLKRSATPKLTFVICIFIMLFAGYEFYIRITFTKTAGLMIVSGFIWLLFLVEQNVRFGIRYFHGLMLIILGICTRANVLYLSLLLLLPVFFMLCLNGMRQHDKFIKRKILKCIIIVVFLLGVSRGLGAINQYAYNTSPLWSDYMSYNAARSTLQDYKITDYSNFRHEYEKLGISKNDYDMWISIANITDPDLLSPEMMEKISSIYPEGRSEILTGAIRDLLRYLTRNTMFYLYVVCLFFFILTNRGKKAWVLVFLSNASWLSAYFYMYYQGRLQHHVDAAVFLTASFVVLYYTGNWENTTEFVRSSIPVIMILLFTISCFYSDISVSSYYGPAFGNIHSQKAYFHENRERMTLLSEDAGHLYLLGAYESNVSYPCFSVFEAIEKGFYHNIYMQNHYGIPVLRASLENFNCRNPLAEISNNSEIYYCASDRRLTDMDIVLTYIREHYNPEAYYTLVKQIDGLNIYRFNEGDLQLDTDNIQKSVSEIIHDITCQNNNGSLTIQGYAFMKNTDSFSQNLYLELEDPIANTTTYYYTLQTENPLFNHKGKSNGEYSSFYAAIDGIDEIQMRNIKINLILENTKGTYRIAVD